MGITYTRIRKISLSQNPLKLMPLSARFDRTPPQSPVKVSWSHQFTTGLEEDVVELFSWPNAGMKTAQTKINSIDMR